MQIVIKAITFLIINNQFGQGNDILPNVNEKPRDFI